MKRIRWWLAKKIVKKLLNSITEDDVLSTKGSHLWRGDFMLSQIDQNSIIGGARTMQNLDTWRALLTDSKFMLNKQMFDRATTGDDLFFARGGLWVLEVMEKKIKNLSKLR